LLASLALAGSWGIGTAVYLYPDVKEEITEKRYLYRVSKRNTPVLPVECSRARGAENRDFIREDAHPERCWITIRAFARLYPDIAQSADLGATLRGKVREELPLENWEGTPFGKALRAILIVFAPVPVLLLAGFARLFR
jgi:hypothetical protein